MRVYTNIVGKNLVGIIDVENNTFSIENKTLNVYNNDTSDFNTKKGSIVCRLNDVYVIVEIKPKTTVYLKKMHDVRKYSDKYSNTNSEIYNAIDRVEEITSKKFWGELLGIKVQKIVIRAFDDAGMTSIDKILSTSISDTASENIPASNVEINEQEEASGNDIETRVDASLKDINNILDKRLNELILRESQLNKKEEQLKEANNELLEQRKKVANLLAYIEPSITSGKSEEILGVIDIASDFSDREPIKYASEQQILYDTILKVLKENDSITLPMEYYKGLKTVILKTSGNHDYSKYIAFAVVRLEEKSPYNILMFIDFNINNTDVKVHVLKPYNTRVIGKNELASIEAQYYNWKKKNSFEVR